ncbi:MAG: hypothetical protein AAF502_11805 [Bacteroidota bacterium]
MPEKKNNTLPIVLGVAVAVLLGLNIYLLYEKMQSKQVLETTQEELTESEQLRLELKDNYDEAVAQLEVLQEENDDLYAQIEEQKEELKVAKEKIDRAIRRGASSKKELADAKTMIEEFKSQTAAYLQEIEALKAENEELTGQTVALTQAKTELEGIVEEKNVETEELTKENEALAEEREKLSAKVEVGSVLKTSFISVMPLRVKENGVEKEVKAAKKTDKLKICFELDENRVTDPGANAVFVRIINPRGETLAIESMGSGSFEDPVSGERTRYTISQGFDYTNDKIDVCVDWMKGDTDFEQGSYIAEIYNKGYLSGKKQFDLK